MNTDYAKQAVVVEMKHGSFVFTPTACDLLSTYGGKLVTPIEMREPRVKVHGVFSLKGVVGNLHANGEASLRHYGKDHRIWIGNGYMLTFTRDSGEILPPDGKRWKAAWMETQDSLKVFQVQVEDWEARCMCLSISREVVNIEKEAGRLYELAQSMDCSAKDLSEYRRSL